MSDIKLLLNINICFFIPLSLTILFCLLGIQKVDAQADEWLDIALQSAHDQKFTIREAMGEKGTVLLFLDPDCPVSQKYGATIRKLSANFDSKGIQVIAIYPVVHITAERIHNFAQEYGFDFTHLLDPRMQLTKAIQASVTPEAFLLDQSGEVLYQGAIDNWFYELGRYRRVVSKHYLLDAVEAYTQQQTIEPNKTAAIGCMIGTGITDDQNKLHH